jgi:hypothetical protein
MTTPAARRGAHAFARQQQRAARASERTPSASFRARRSGRTGICATRASLRARGGSALPRAPRSATSTPAPRTHLVRPGGGHQRRRRRRKRRRPVCRQPRLRLGRRRRRRLALARRARAAVCGHGSRGAAWREARQRRAAVRARQSARERASAAPQRRQQQRLQRRAHAARCRRTRPHATQGGAGRRSARRAASVSRPRHRLGDECRPEGGLAERHAGVPRKMRPLTAARRVSAPSSSHTRRRRAARRDATRDARTGGATRVRLDKNQPILRQMLN